MNNISLPDSFNDDQQIYYLDDIAHMLEGRKPLSITNDHIEALKYEVCNMTTIPNMGSIHKKLSVIQQALKVPKKHYNDYSKFYYRTSDDIYEAVKPLTVKNDCVLTITDEPWLVGERIYIKATATISDGNSAICVNGYAREPDVQKGMSESQISGTASSFAHKYALSGMFLIDDTQDIDSQPAADTLSNDADQISNILAMVKNNDISQVNEQWNGVITEYWNQLDSETCDQLNKIRSTPV